MLPILDQNRHCVAIDIGDFRAPSLQDRNGATVAIMAMRSKHDTLLSYSRVFGMLFSFKILFCTQSRLSTILYFETKACENHRQLSAVPRCQVAKRASPVGSFGVS